MPKQPTAEFLFEQGGEFVEQPSRGCSIEWLIKWFHNQFRSALVRFKVCDWLFQFPCMQDLLQAALLRTENERLTFRYDLVDNSEMNKIFARKTPLKFWHSPRISKNTHIKLWETPYIV